MRLDAMILVFWMWSFKPTFSFCSFMFIKRLFSSLSLSAIRVVSPVYLRLLIFLLEIFIPAYASSSPTFRMIHSAHKLNKHGDNIQPWCAPFPIWSQSVAPRPVLSVACFCVSNSTALSVSVLSVCAPLLSCVQLFVAAWTAAHQAPLSQNIPGKNTGMGCHFLLQRFFLTQGSHLCSLCLLLWQLDSLRQLIILTSQYYCEH